MILSFSTKINGNKTHFPEKILKCIDENKLSDEPLKWGIASKHHPEKKHTIRKDEKDRWKVGTMIDFYINARTKDMYCFAPRIPVVSTQSIWIGWYSEKRDLEPSKLAPKIYNYVEVFIENNQLEIEDIKKLAINDGFESVEDFFSYFNENFNGKLIHWTDIKY